MKHPRIAVAQIKYFNENREHNVDKIKRFIRMAKKENADIVCFPEVAISKKEKLHFEHEFIYEIREECKMNSIWCIVSDEFKVKNKEFNMAVLIDRNGDIKGDYKKIFLYYEKKMTPGKIARVFNTDFGKIGMAICWDLAFPELFARMKKLGAEIVFCPALWWYEPWAHKDYHKNRETKLLKSLLQSRAFENLFYVAVCNPIVKEKFQISYSAIAAPHHIISEIEDKEGLITADVDLSEIKKFMRLYPGKQRSS